MRLRLEVIKHAHGPALTAQEVGERGANETAAAGD